MHTSQIYMQKTILCAYKTGKLYAEKTPFMHIKRKNYAENGAEWLGYIFLFDFQPAFFTAQSPQEQNSARAKICADGYPNSDQPVIFYQK